MASATITLADPALAAAPAKEHHALADYNIHSDVGEILFTRQQMHERVHELGKQLAMAYQVGSEVVYHSQEALIILKEGITIACTPLAAVKPALLVPASIQT